MRHKPDEFLGIDVGNKRVGLARGSSAARIAQPLKTVAAQAAVAELLVLVKQYQAAGIVVGLPRNLDGEETAQTKTVRAWAEQAKAKLELPFYWQDEALTSRIAEQNASAAVGPDAVAASVILQDFLDTPKEQRVRC